MNQLQWSRSVRRVILPTPRRDQHPDGRWPGQQASSGQLAPCSCWFAVRMDGTFGHPNVAGRWLQAEDSMHYHSRVSKWDLTLVWARYINCVLGACTAPKCSLTRTHVYSEARGSEHVQIYRDRSRNLWMYAKRSMLPASRLIDEAWIGLSPVFNANLFCVLGNEMVISHENATDFESSDME